MFLYLSIRDFLINKNKTGDKMIKNNRPLYEMHRTNNKSEQHISIAILCATIWIVLIGYLLSLPVNADEGDYMISDDMQSYMESIGHGEIFELEDVE
jgi:hypothetical protein